MSGGRAIQVLYVANQKNHTVDKRRDIENPNLSKSNAVYIFANLRYSLNHYYPHHLSEWFFLSLNRSGRIIWESEVRLQQHKTNRSSAVAVSKKVNCSGSGIRESEIQLKQHHRNRFDPLLSVSCSSCSCRSIGKILCGKSIIELYILWKNWSAAEMVWEKLEWSCNGTRESGVQLKYSMRQLQ